MGRFDPVKNDLPSSKLLGKGTPSCKCGMHACVISSMAGTHVQNFRKTFAFLAKSFAPNRAESSANVTWSCAGFPEMDYIRALLLTRSPWILGVVNPRTTPGFVCCNPSGNPGFEASRGGGTLRNIATVPIGAAYGHLPLRRHLTSTSAYAYRLRRQSARRRRAAAHPQRRRRRRRGAETQPRLRRKSAPAEAQMNPG